AWPTGMPWFLNTLSEVPEQGGSLIVKIITIFENRLLASRRRPKRHVGVILISVLLWASGANLVNAARVEDSGSKPSSSSRPGDEGKAPAASRPDSSPADTNSAPASATDADRYKSLDDKVRKLEDIVKQQQSVIDSLQNRLSELTSPNMNRAAAPPAPESARASSAPDP